MRDYQRQLDAQRESLVSRRDDDADFRDKMTSKNRLLNAALEENRVSGLYFLINLSSLAIFFF